MNKEALLKLAHHLEFGKLAHKQFDFNVYNANGKNNGIVSHEFDCGTNGCALGECPGLFEGWAFHYNGVKYRDYNGLYIDLEAAVVFFTLTYVEARLLFAPDVSNFYNSQFEPKNLGMKRLPTTATAIDVANQIKQFIELKEKINEI